VRRDQFIEQMKMAENINERFRRNMARQVNIAMNLSRISPAASFRLIAASLSATGPQETGRFWQALVDYREQLCRFAYDSWAEMATDNHKRQLARLGGQNTYHIEAYPRFNYQYLSLGDRLAEVLSDVVVLCVWCGLFFIAGYVVFSRGDVT
jgi:ABC-type transport system involved in multi-copper enzyme maturation permease subunit